jgi:hypothetical protein
MKQNNCLRTIVFMCFDKKKDCLFFRAWGEKVAIINMRDRCKYLAGDDICTNKKANQAC